jgi:hypothetical protein
VRGRAPSRPPLDSRGYVLAAADGAAFSFADGRAFRAGSLAGTPLAAPVVAID